MKTTRSARAANRWLSRPCSVAEAPRERIVRHDAEPTSLETSTTGRAASPQAPDRACDDLRSMSRSASMQLVSHSVRQSTSTAAPAARAASASASIVRRVDRRPAVSRRALCAAMRAAISSSRASRRRDVDPGRRQRGDEALGVAALAGAGAAEHERQQPVPGSAAAVRRSAGVGRSERGPGRQPPSRTQNTASVVSTDRDDEAADAGFRESAISWLSGCGAPMTCGATISAIAADRAEPSAARTRAERDRAGRDVTVADPPDLARRRGRPPALPAARAEARARARA